MPKVDGLGALLKHDQLVADKRAGRRPTKAERRAAKAARAAASGVLSPDAVRSLSIIDCLQDPALFGGLPEFADLATWKAWLVFLRALYGLPMSDEDLEIFRRHTGRITPRPHGYPEAMAIVGVQSGKSMITSVITAYEALRGSSGTYAVSLAQDERSAKRVLLAYAKRPFRELDAFRAQVVPKEKKESQVVLANGVALVAYPCRPAALRGIRCCVVALDELSFFQTSDGRPNDTEMLAVARGRVATTGGKLVCISSPYGQSGATWDLHRAHYGVEDSTTLVWQASAPDMNPTLSKNYLEKMQLEDPERYISEVLGEFRAGLTTLFDPAAIDNVVAHKVPERLPIPGMSYTSFADPSTAGGGDAFVISIAHLEDDVAVLDKVQAWNHQNTEGVIAEACDVLRRYGVTEISGDLYAGSMQDGRAVGFVADTFAKHGIRYEKSTRNRSALYLELLPLVNSAKVLLLDEPHLLKELRGLERRRSSGGVDRVDHRRGAHDDRANAAAGALVTVAGMARFQGVRLRNIMLG